MDTEMLPPLPASSPAPSPADGAMAPPATPSTTPSKNLKKRLSEATVTESDNEGDDISVKKVKTGSKESTPSARKRKAPGKDVLKGAPMGKTFKQCSDQDKMLIEWKEAGRTWEDIRKKWSEMTGDVTATSTLPNRYSRLKSNFVVIKEEHNALLLQCKQEVEATFEVEKWFLVREAMHAKGAEKYKPVELQRQYKNLLKLGIELKAERDQRIQANPDLVKKGKGKARASSIASTVGGDAMDED